MNPSTGDIREFTTDEEREQGRRDGYTQPIPPEQLDEVRGMNRAQRRAWARKQRRSGKGR